MPPFSFSELVALKERFKERLVETALTPEEEQRIDNAARGINSAGYDDWGLDPKTLKAAASIAKWIYTDYFRVDTAGIENVPEGRALLVANHGGQIPIDAMLVVTSLLLAGTPPRLARGMVERWAPSLPFVSTFFARCGQIVGDHRNCRELLEREECVLVFPEGVTGSGKTIFHRYELQRFGTGFMRLALETKAPIVPIAVIGCEETYPSVLNLEWLAKLVRAPYLPVTPFFPFLGPLGALPLPTKVTLRYGKPLFFDADPDSPDSEVYKLVDQVREAMKSEIEIGLKNRGERLFTGSGAKST